MGVVASFILKFLVSTHYGFVGATSQLISRWMRWGVLNLHYMEFLALIAGPVNVVHDVVEKNNFWLFHRNCLINF